MEATRKPVADARALRALSHPRRLELLALLRFEGESTATLLARRLGESSGATSYHLRQLAQHGFIEEAPARGGRERYWRYRERPVTLPAPARETAAERAAAARLMGELLGREAH